MHGQNHIKSLYMFRAGLLLIIRRINYA